MPSKIKAVFFDSGNTLIYPRLEELAQELTRTGYPATVEDFHAAERAGKAKLDEWLWPQITRGEVPRQIDHYYWTEYLRALVVRVGVPTAEQLRVAHDVAEGFRDITLWSRVLPETPPFLESLRERGYYLGVISNSIGTMQQQLERVGLARYFKIIIDSALVGVEKPHPEIFSIALSRAGVEPSESVFVGDTHATDIGGARLAGLTGVLIDRVGAYSQVECPRILSLPELTKVLNGRV